MQSSQVQLKLATKYPDPTSNFGQTIIRPFDGLGMVEKEDGLHFLCWEGKYLSKMCAFNFGMVQPHQHAYLMEYSKAIGVEAYLVVGVKFARGKNFIYVFDYKDVNILFIKRKSIHSKFLMKLPYMQVHKNKIEFDLNNVITLDKLKEVYGEQEWQKLLSDA